MECKIYLSRSIFKVSKVRFIAYKRRTINVVYKVRCVERAVNFTAPDTMLKLSISK